MPALRYFQVLLLWLILSRGADAGPVRTEVEVTLFALPETVWQARFEGQYPEQPALWLRLNADADEGQLDRPLDMKCLLVDEEPVVQRRGAEKDFVEGWQSQDWQADTVRPMSTTKRFIGTSVELSRQALKDSGETLRVNLNLEHHLAQPVMHRMNYANAAVGAERDKLSVEYPIFEKIEWKGTLAVSRQWRLVCNLLRPQSEGKNAAPAMRYLVFIKRP